MGILMVSNIRMAPLLISQYWIRTRIEHVAAGVSFYNIWSARQRGILQKLGHIVCLQSGLQPEDMLFLKLSTWDTKKMLPLLFFLLSIWRKYLKDSPRINEFAFMSGGAFPRGNDILNISFPGFHTMGGEEAGEKYKVRESTLST